jgi:CDP-glucose 4,6-dehydratase
MTLDFYKNKKVFVTGHTGFKGTWLCRVLLQAGANVSAYALPPATGPSLFEQVMANVKINSVIGDIRDREMFIKTIHEEKPEIVFHLAAQP